MKYETAFFVLSLNYSNPIPGQKTGRDRVLGASSLIAPLLHPYIHSYNDGSGYKDTINLEYKKSFLIEAKIL